MSYTYGSKKKIVKCENCIYLREKYLMQLYQLGNMMDICTDQRICTNEESPYYWDSINMIYNEECRDAGCGDGKLYES